MVLQQVVGGLLDEAVVLIADGFYGVAQLAFVLALAIAVINNFNRTQIVGGFGLAGAAVTINASVAVAMGAVVEVNLVVAFAHFHHFVEGAVLQGAPVAAAKIVAVGVVLNRTNFIDLSSQIYS